MDTILGWVTDAAVEDNKVFEYEVRYRHYRCTVENHKKNKKAPKHFTLSATSELLLFSFAIYKKSYSALKLVFFTITSWAEPSLIEA